MNRNVAGLSGRSSAPVRVLVVDDQPDITETVGAVLEGIGHEPRVASDGRTALAIADEFRPDVVLLDLSLPDMSGLEVAYRMRAGAQGEDVVIAAITGSADLVDPSPSGFDHVLTKPVELAVLREIVETARSGDAAQPRPRAVEPAVGLRSLDALIAAADRACRGDDADELAATVLDVMAIAPDGLAIDLVAVAEIGRYDMDLARERWARVRGQLR